ncbi:hypothetical protein TrRE_jg8891, partial [Triparma retinervis]
MCAVEGTDYVAVVRVRKLTEEARIEVYDVKRGGRVWESKEMNRGIVVTGICSGCSPIDFGATASIGKASQGGCIALASVDFGAAARREERGEGIGGRVESEVSILQLAQGPENGSVRLRGIAQIKVPGSSYCMASTEGGRRLVLGADEDVVVMGFGDNPLKPTVGGGAKGKGG